MPKRLVLATHNASKQGELRKLFVDWPVQLVPSADLGARPPVEDQDTFIGNARLKAEVTSSAFDVVALCDVNKKWLDEALNTARTRQPGVEVQGYR